MNALRRVLAITAVTAAVLGMIPAGPARAQTLRLVTDYPAVTVGAGKPVTFDIDVITPQRERVSLQVIEKPKGWRTTLRGGGFIINGVFGDPEEPPVVQLEVGVPRNASRGQHGVTIRGVASSGAVSTLQLLLRVAAGVSGAVDLTADFAELRGQADTTFTYSLTLTNNTPEDSVFSLTAKGPQGWNVEARPSAQEQAATLEVEGGGSGSITVEADPPDDAEADKYELEVTAQSGSKRAQITLITEITGNVSLTLTTPDERLNADARAGKGTEVEIRVVNEGASPVQNVELSSTPPTGWEVDFKPKKISRINAKARANVIAVITPIGEAVAGDYLLTISASAEGASDDAEFRITVKTSRFFGLLGLVIIALVVYVLLRVFRQFGRR